MKNDLGLQPDKMVTKPLLVDDQKIERKFSNWVQTNLPKEDTVRILFSDEKFFDVDGIYNSQNDRMRAVSSVDTNKKGGMQQRQKFLQKVMVSLGACSQSVTPLMILDDGTVDHTIYIEKVLPVALKYGGKFFDSD